MTIKNLKVIFILVLAAVPLGALSGVIGASFAKLTVLATDFRLANGTILFLLPFGGIIIHLLYKIFNDNVDEGSNLIVKSITQGEFATPVVFPLIYISAVFSHLLGASVGRVGTTIQLGGTLGESLSLIFRLEKKNRDILIMSAIAGVLSAMFGTPITAAVLAVEFTRVLRPHIRALVPALISSFTARKIGIMFGLPNTRFLYGEFPEITPKTIGFCILLAIIAGFVGLLYVFSISNLKIRLCLLVPNFVLRSILFGSILLVLSLVFGNQTYNGMGVSTITEAFKGNVIYYAFLVKIVFTTISFAAGYKGGEVFPAIFIGATLGAAFGNIVGLTPGFFAAVSTGAIFSAITNCPLAAFFLSLEYFGTKGAVIFAISIVIGFLVSGRNSIFPAQDYLGSSSEDQI